MIKRLNKGITKIKHYCIDCNKELKNVYAQRCLHCRSIHRYKLGTIKLNKGTGIGIDSLNWKGGKPKCIDCGNQLSDYRYTRCSHCSKIGKLNVNYIDGSSGIYPVEFNDILKESIRKRDNYTCQNCNMTEEEHIIVVGKVLSVHHIDYDKINCKSDNLITLCDSCNLRANYNRSYWKEIYTNKVGAKND
jgi:ribosomal protein L34E